MFVFLGDNIYVGTHWGEVSRGDGLPNPRRDAIPSGLTELIRLELG